MIHIFKHRKGQAYEQIKLEKKNRLFFLLVLTLQVPIVTNINFFLTISIQGQEITFIELMKLSPKRKCFDLLSNSLNLCTYQCKSRGEGVRARGGDLMPETIPMSGF